MSPPRPRAGGSMNSMYRATSPITNNNPVTSGKFNRVTAVSTPDGLSTSKSLATW